MSERHPDIIRRIELAAEQQPHYRQAPEVAAQTADFELVTFIAPAAEGKSTLMEAIAQRDPDFGYVTGFTTRSPEDRDVPGRYRYYNSNEEIGELLDDIEAGKVVQYAPHPTTDELYGSHPSDYNGHFSMLDALYNSLPQIEASGFGQVHRLFVVSHGKEWVGRFLERYPTASPERDKRLAEGFACLEWAVEQPHGSLGWVVNADGALDAAVDEAIALVRQTRRSRQLQLLAKEMIHEMRKAL